MHRPGKAGKHLANATEVQNRNMLRVSISRGDALVLGQGLTGRGPE